MSNSSRDALRICQTSQPWTSRWRPASAALWCGLLAGCIMGPDYHRPKLSESAGYLDPDQSVSPAMDGNAQRFSNTRDVPAQWWTEFGSPEINRFVEQALARNPDLASAQAALRAARSTLIAQRGTLFPQVDLGATASRQRNSGTLASPLNSNAEDYSLYTGQLNIAYTPDVFGGIRRQIETVAAQTENQKFTVEATYLTLTSNVVVAAIQVASLQAQIQANEAIVKADQDALDALNLQRRLGEASGVDVATQESTLAQAKAALPPLRKQLGQQQHLLAQLTGTTPSEFDKVSMDLSALRLPAELPLSLPTKLVEQRPDIRAAEANVHAASAQVGVAIANRLPNISLSAALGGASTEIGTVLSGGNALWAVTGGVTQPIFDAGTLRARQHAAEAQLDQAKEQYRSTLLTAFQNVADALLALSQDSDALVAATNAEAAGLKSVKMALMRLQQGEGNIAALTLAEQAYQQGRAAKIQAQAARYSDTAGLFQALGGGWWRRGEADQIPAHTTAD
jgi:NodT family efflux transporter outer membrane factor (OMF) lipoprotein